MFTVRLHRSSPQRDLLAREVAERCVSDTLRQLNASAGNMSPAELRGYVRAHATMFIREEATQLVGREWPKQSFDELVATALEQVMHLVVTQIKSHPVVVVPVPHVRLRLAA